jgi:hypothetical protein
MFEIRKRNNALSFTYGGLPVSKAASFFGRIFFSGSGSGFSIVRRREASTSAGKFILLFFMMIPPPHILNWSLQRHQREMVRTTLLQADRKTYKKN